jgi:hypothetical protein
VSALVDLVADPWLRASAAVGLVMVGVTTIVGLPWPLWFAWAYVVVLSAYDVTRTSPDRDLPEGPDAVG